MKVVCAACARHYRSNRRNTLAARLKRVEYQLHALVRLRASLIEELDASYAEVAPEAKP